MMRTIATLFASAAMLASCTTVGDSPARSLQPGDDYVALGSSFAAGAGIGALKPGSPERCGRTVNNYASLLAETLQLDLTDASCGGAKTEHLLGPWSELPPQLDAVTADTDLVTITIGGNDLNYVGSLFQASCQAGLMGPVDKCFSLGAPGEEDYAAVRANFDSIIADIRGRSPDARIVLVQYVTLVSETPCAAMPMSAAEAAQAREIGARLSALTADAARDNDVDLLSLDTASVGHTACDAEPWSQAMGPGFDSSKGMPWHPNAKGHAVAADMLAAMLGG